jgi:hypothetical protein
MNMRKIGLLSTGILLFLSASILAPVPSAFPGKVPAQDLPQRLKFYALQVICGKNVQNARDSLGAPDGRYAEILPGGQLVLLLEGKLYPFPTPGDEPGSGAVGLSVSGLIIGKGDADFRLEGLFAWQDIQDRQRSAWIPMGLWGGGFGLFPHVVSDSFDPKAGMDMIKISNVGTESLFVDAVIGQSNPFMN